MTQTEHEPQRAAISLWAKFAIDDPVMVRDHPGDKWQRRYFSGVSKRGKPQTWALGATSWSDSDENYHHEWNYCRRPTPDELEAAQ